MGLTLSVGRLAEQAQDLDGDELLEAQLPYDMLNQVLADAQMSPHLEPLDLAPAQCWSSDMWGYGGLHAIRRLAAYLELRGTLPPPAAYSEYADDPILAELNNEYLKWDATRGKQGLAKLLAKRLPQPKFQHLQWHSDAEGFYIPVSFQNVIFDSSNPQRVGVGCMVGSSKNLLDECLVLAHTIALPEDIDEEDDDLIEAAESPSTDASDWRRFGVEAFGLVRLIEGCNRSIATGAALVFT